MQGKTGQNLKNFAGIFSGKPGLACKAACWIYNTRPFCTRNTDGLELQDNAQGTVTSTHIAFNQAGIKLTGDHMPVAFSNSVITQNAVGIQCSQCANTLPTLTQSSIYSNTQHAVQVENYSGSSTFNLTENWWGTQDPNVIAAAISLIARSTLPSQNFLI